MLGEVLARRKKPKRGVLLREDMLFQSEGGPVIPIARAWLHKRNP